MASMKWCNFCKDYYPNENYNDHMNQHRTEMNSDAMEHKQYTGFHEKKQSDYMICILHQKKCPCPVKNCNLQPFGCIKKSWMLKCAKGIIGDEKKLNDKPEGNFLNTGSIRVEPFFPYSTRQGEQIMVPIDMKTKTVILMGTTIHLRI